jgi:hypothetical protein
MIILHNHDLVPSKRRAIEELLGRELLDGEAIGLWSFTVETRPDAERQAAADKLRALLSEPGPSTGVSSEEFEAAYLEAMRSVRPGYTEIK